MGLAPVGGSETSLPSISTWERFITGGRFRWISGQSWSYVINKSLNDSEISLQLETNSSSTRISLTWADLLPLPVSEFINFQPCLRVSSLGRIDLQVKVVRFRFTRYRIYLFSGRLIKYAVVGRVACVAGVGRGRKEERRAREGREDRTREDRGRGRLQGCY